MHLFLPASVAMFLSREQVGELDILEKEPAANETQSIEHLKASTCWGAGTKSTNSGGKMLWKKFSERTPRTYLILFNFLLYLGHQGFMYVFSKSIRIASEIPDCLIALHDCLATWLLNLLHNLSWRKNLQEGCVEQESLGLIAGSRADLLCISGLSFLTVLPRKQDWKLCQTTCSVHFYDFCD